MHITQITGFVPALNIKGKAHRKEAHFRASYILFDMTTKSELVTVRVYRTDRVAYACAWVSDGKGGRGTGSSSAGGGGYDKEEHAVKHAFMSAGVEMAEYYNEQRPEAILEGLAVYFGLKDWHIFRAHP